MKKVIFFNLSLLFVLVVQSSFAQKPDVVVAADGTGDAKNVQEAIDKVPVNNSKRFIISIKPGIYKEQIRIPANKPFISFIGTDAVKTILSFGLSNKEAGSTSAAYATYIGGHDFHAVNITFENSFDYKPGQSGSQAVAVLSEADRLVFKNCRFLGWQDTLYAKNGRQYFENSYIEGNVDFIFGQASAIFSNCVIHSKADGYITAPMRFAPDEPSGFVFINCKLTGSNIDKGVFLGRPWRAFGRTVFMSTTMGEHIRAEGWDNWRNAENEKTAYFAEYNSKGGGAKTDARVKWAHQISKEEAKLFETENFLKGNDGWNPKTATDDWLEKTKPDYRLVSWNQVLNQSPLWYQTDEAARIADQVVLYQKDNGGWEKNIDMAAMLTHSEKETLTKSKTGGETTIDNKATYTQIAFLGKLITASLMKTTPPNNFPKYKEAFNKGIDYLLSSQYENGGFPQFFPLQKGYYTHITFNDDAMIGVLELFRDIVGKKDDFKFVDEERRLKAEQSFAKGLQVILKTQVTTNGVKSVWCAQHDEVTFAPAPARNFEPISLSGAESVEIVKFLMKIEEPSQEVIDAVESAVKWFERSKIKGIRVDTVPVKDSPRGFDRVVVADKNAPPLWARFYDIATNRPIFTGRDKVVRNSLAEIEIERRTGYGYYTNAPQRLLEVDYPKWKIKIAVK